MAQTLQEYLVTLGWQIDQGTQNRFQDAIKNTRDGVEHVAKGVDSLVTKFGQAAIAATAAAASVGVAIVRMSGPLRELGLNARNIGAPADQIRSFAYGLQQVGNISGSRTTAWLKTLAEFEATHPGGLKVFAPTIKDSDTLVEKAQKISEQWAKLSAQGPGGRAQAMLTAQQNLGVDMELFNTLIRTGDVQRYFNEEMARLRPVGLDASIQAATDLQHQVARLSANFEAFQAFLVREFGPDVTRVFTSINDAWERVVGGVEGGIHRLHESFGGVITTLHNFWQTLSPGQQAAAQDIGIFSVLRGGTAVIGGFLEIVGRFTGLNLAPIVSRVLGPLGMLALGAAQVDWSPTINAIRGLVSALETADEKSHGAAGALQALRAAGQAFGASIEVVDKLFRGAFEAVQIFATGAVRIITAMVRGDWAGVWQAAKNTVVTAFNEAVAGIESVFPDFVRQSWGRLANPGSEFYRDLQANIDAFSRIWTALTSGFGEWKQNFSKDWEATWSGFKGVASTVTTGSPIWSDFTAGFDAWKVDFGKDWDATWNGLKNVATAVMDSAYDAIKAIWDKLTAEWNSLKQTFDSVFGFLKPKTPEGQGGTQQPNTTTMPLIPSLTAYHPGEGFPAYEGVADFMRPRAIGGRFSGGGARPDAGALQAIAPPSPEHGAAEEELAGLEKERGLPAGILDRIWAQESGRGRHMMSQAGAMGHFQFMAGTAQRFGVTNPFDFHQAARGAADYVRSLLDMFKGSVSAALGGYNAGEGRVQQSMRQFGSDWLSHLPAETQNYVARILGQGQYGAPSQTAGYGTGAGVIQPPTTAGDKNITINAPVNADIRGVQNPDRVGRHLQDVMARSNQNLLRHTQAVAI